MLPEKTAGSWMLGCYVMPGLIDLHVHLHDPGFTYKETVDTGAEAAAHGGFTTIVAMPNTKPVMDEGHRVSYVHNKAKMLGLINVLQAGAVTKGMRGEELSDIESMVNRFPRHQRGRQIRHELRTLPEGYEDRQISEHSGAGPL